MRPLDPVDADHTAAWKGTAVHDVLEQWFKQDDCDPATLVAARAALVGDEAIHPMLRALWQPRLIEAVQWIAGAGRGQTAPRAAARVPPNCSARREIAGVELYGKVDRIDVLADGSLAIIDYKTGKAPSAKAVARRLRAAARAARADRRARRLRGHRGQCQRVRILVAGQGQGSASASASAPTRRSRPGRSSTTCSNASREAAGKYLTGDEPFVAKLHPAYAPYGDYDQLMRLEEWYGRD